LNPGEKSAVLQNIAFALQGLQATLYGHDLELHYASQLSAYVQQLQQLSPAQTPDEQFNYSYQLRKWLFWIPVALLQQQSGQGPALLTLAHFYATALLLEPLFPDLGSSFCSATALLPLEAIIAVTDAMRNEHGMDTSSMEIASLMQFPRQTAMQYRARAMQTQHALLQQEQPSVGLDPDVFSYTNMGNLSPAFAPSTPHFASSQSTSSSSTPFLEVPSSRSFTFGTQSWGAMPSPGLPPQSYTSSPAQMYGSVGFTGFVQPAIWT
jgi:hypothetical protein